jgi:hypothetical protein
VGWAKLAGESPTRGRVRREAIRYGLKLQKLRNGRGYWLIDRNTNALILGDGGTMTGYDLRVIERELAS